MKSLKNLTDDELMGLRLKLVQWGYLPPLSGEDVRELVHALRKYQRAYRVPVTGDYDNATAELIENRNCDFPDWNLTEDDIRQEGPYDAGGDPEDPFTLRARTSIWPAATPILYQFASYADSDDISDGSQRELMQRGFDRWAGYAGLTFTRLIDSSATTPQIIIRNWNFGNNDPPGGDTLGRAHFPTTAPNFAVAGTNIAQIRFNTEHRWADRAHWQAILALFPLNPVAWHHLNTNIFKDYLAVAIHEAGHALGLGHSNNKSAIMWPSTDSSEEEWWLHRDDIRAIRSLYPRPFPYSTPTTTVSVPRRFVSGMLTGNARTDSEMMQFDNFRRFLAWGSTTWIESSDDFDSNNAGGFDIFAIGDVNANSRPTDLRNHEFVSQNNTFVPGNPSRLDSLNIGGDPHLGTFGAASSMYEGAVAGRTDRIQFRAQVFGGDHQVFSSAAVILFPEPTGGPSGQVDPFPPIPPPTGPPDINLPPGPGPGPGTPPDLPEIRLPSGPGPDPEPSVLPSLTGELEPSPMPWRPGIPPELAPLEADNPCASGRLETTFARGRGSVGGWESLPSRIVEKKRGG